MKDYIEERAVAIANYIIDHNATVRQTAKKFGISKSTVHKDMVDGLPCCSGCFTGKYPLDPPKEDIRGDYER